jgi:hypothetical protein
MLLPDSSLAPGTIMVEAGSLLTVLPQQSTSAAPTTSSSATASASSTTTTTIAVPTPNGETPSSSTDQLTPYDPRACPVAPPTSSH